MIVVVSHFLGNMFSEGIGIKGIRERRDKRELGLGRNETIQRQHTSIIQTQ